MVVELRKQFALESKLRGRFGKLSFVNVCGSSAPKARDGFAVANFLRRWVALVDPLPDEPAEPVVARGAVRVIFPDVQNKFVISHLNSRTHCSSLLHRDVERDLQSLLQSLQQTRSQVVSGVSLKVQHRLARDAQATRELEPRQPQVPSPRLDQSSDVNHEVNSDILQFVCQEAVQSAAWQSY